MDYLVRHKIIVLTIIFQLITLPAVLFVTKQAQDTQTKASAPTSIFITPETTSENPQVIQKGQYFSSNIIIEPGSNIISEAHIEIVYDPTKIELVKDNPVFINSDVFPTVTTKPIIQNGTVSFSIISEAAKPLTQRQKAATIYFKALEEVSRSQIYFGANTKLFGLNDKSTNLIQSTSPEIISISSPSAKSATSTFPKFK